jgi:hypothetical protein
MPPILEQELAALPCLGGAFVVRKRAVSKVLWVATKRRVAGGLGCKMPKAGAVAAG